MKLKKITAKENAKNVAGSGLVAIMIEFYYAKDVENC